MNDHRPVVLGYVRRHLCIDDDHLDAILEWLHRFAETEGLRLAKTFVEDPLTAPLAFNTLLGVATQSNAIAVMIPGQDHLDVLGGPAATKQHLEHHTGARVMIAAP